VNITTKGFALVAVSFFFVTPARNARAVEKLVPKDALVLEKKIPVRQFPDAKGKGLATLHPCDEVLLLESPGQKKSVYVKVLFLSADAQKVRSGWIRRDSPLYIFPEPRPAIPRTDTTPAIAFPWAEKAPQPGDPDYARVTHKSFLFSCLQRPHPAKTSAILTQILDRYASELTVDEVVQLLPLLVHSKDEDRPRIRELLQKFKEYPEVANFLAANPLFGPVIEPEIKQAPVYTPIPTPSPPEVQNKLFNISYKVLGLGLVGAAVGLLLIALVLRSRKRNRPGPSPIEPTFPDSPDQGPAL